MLDIKKEIARTQHVFKHYLIKHEHNKIMQYITITFNQRDASILSSIFARFPPHFKEVQTKKYLWPIQGLISRSFEYPNGVPATVIQSLFFSKCCPTSYIVSFVFI